MPAKPQNILYVRADSFGDLILFAPALSELMQAWPEANHTLLVRNGYESLTPLFPKKLGWLAVGLNASVSDLVAATVGSGLVALLAVVIARIVEIGRARSRPSVRWEAPADRREPPAALRRPEPVPATITARSLGPNGGLLAARRDRRS